jgi:hypothetical protein
MFSQYHSNEFIFNTFSLAMLETLFFKLVDNPRDATGIANCMTKFKIVPRLYLFNYKQKIKAYQRYFLILD